MLRFVVLPVLLLSVGCLGGGCGPAESAGPVKASSEPAAEGGVAEGTLRMREELERLRRAEEAEPLRYYYQNRRRAELVRADLSRLRGADRRAARFALATELLKAGETEAAIEIFEELLDVAGASRVRDELQAALAVAFLRLGEQQNCVQNHAAESCIFPLRGDGLHARPYGSEAALERYLALLARAPQDYTSRWLANVASMTLGAYPQRVPPEILIPGLASPPSAPLPRFDNVAVDAAVAERGLAGGVAVADFDGDGRLDLLTSSFRLEDPLHLYLNDERGGYVDRTEAAGLAGLSGGLNLVHADYDNDGDPDVLVLRGAWLGDRGAHPNSLLKNNGDGTFEDVTFAAGLGSYHPTGTAAWADVDGDGWLDLFVGNEGGSRWLSTWQSDAESGTARHRSELFLNNGDGTFTEAAELAGLSVEAFVKAAAWGDVDNDGRPDLYLSVLGGPNRLFLNRPGSGGTGVRFEEAGAQAGVHEPFFSFPAWFWDYDNDGWEDLFVGAYDLRRINDAAADVAREALGLPVDTETARLFRNNGDGTFTDVTEAVGLDRAALAMGAGFGDLDNDGWEDLYLGTGAPDLEALVPNRMFRNVRGERFEEVTLAGGFGHIQKGHGIAFADLDADGDQDVYAVMGGFFEGDVFGNALFENPGSGAAWVTLQLEGRRANRSALGARIRLTVTDRDGGRRVIHRTVSTGGSFGASSLQQEVGLGEAVRIDELRIRWPGPGGTVDVHTGIEPGRVLRVVEGGSIEVRPGTPSPFRRAPMASAPDAAAHHSSSH